MVELNICGVINKHMTLKVYSSSCIIISDMQSRPCLQISLSTSQVAAHATTASISGGLGAAVQTTDTAGVVWPLFTLLNCH